VEVHTVRSIIAGRCVRRTTPSAPKQPDPIAVWAAQVVANPSAFCASEREAGIIAELAAQLPGATR
jgi:hypothetical protein